MVYILLAPGFEEAEALVPVDMLRRANIETATVSITGEPVPGSHGVTVLADVTLDDVDLSAGNDGGEGSKGRSGLIGEELLLTYTDSGGDTLTAGWSARENWEG